MNSIHGGTTFSGFCTPEEKEHGICHTVEEGEDANVWWFGFDCAHCFDYIPHLIYHSERQQLATEIYRNVDYVKQQCGRLAAQLSKAC